MGNNGVNGTFLTNGLQFLNSKYRVFISPIDITGQRLIFFRQMVVWVTNTIRSVNRYSTAYTEDVTTTSPYHSVVWYGHPSTMLYWIFSKVGRIVMVTPDKQDPVVRLRQALTITIINVLIVALSFKSEATVTSNDDQRVRHSVLNAALVNEFVELAMDIPADDYAFGFWEIEKVYSVSHITV